MSEDDTLTKALADVRGRMGDLQAEYDRISAELTKLKVAERSLAAIVEGAPLEGNTGFSGARAEAGDGPVRAGRGGRGSRGPRANSAKGRLKTLLEEAGPQGLSHAEIARRLSDVAPNTLNTYLSVMANSGEAVRRGDFYSAGTPSPSRQGEPDDEAEAQGADEEAGAEGEV